MEPATDDEIRTIKVYFNPAITFGVPMRPPSSTLDVLQTVTRRRPLLEALESEPRDKQALCESLECSRSTVDRGIRELEWLQFLRRDEGTYRLTVAGRLALAEQRRSAETLESIGDASELLADVPRGAPMSAALLAGARTIEPPSHAPAKPLQAIVDLVSSAERVRGVSAAERVPQLRTQLYDSVVDGDLEGEAVVTAEFARFIREEYPDWVTDVVIDGGFDLHVIDSVPYELALVETPSESRVFVFVHDESTAIRGLIENETPEAFEWGERVYREFRDASTPLSPSM
ncbi:transcriptional regulator [Natronococcus pandeyae]|uniref:Transcriptional regulator n=1 Tax=Natronococcus pandeyae TaxID=2055836 RepID=A0A8J8Q4B0_9EURY|nr:transcriptional regulator [Natronococcus pandeyae]TYL38502.1 transcriptional regulator [Natronococcus pandeyae]